MPNFPVKDGNGANIITNEQGPVTTYPVRDGNGAAIVKAGTNWSVRGARFDGADGLYTPATTPFLPDNRKSGALSTWWRSPVTGVVRRLLSTQASTPGFVVQLSTIDRPQLVGRNAAFAVIMNSETGSGTGWGPSNEWRHLAMSWDLSVASKVQILVDGSLHVAVTTHTDDFINYRDNAIGIGMRPVALTDKLTGDLREFMFWPHFINWTNPVAMARVRKAGAPVDPGPTGANVTGDAPWLYHTIRDGETAEAFAQNRGLLGTTFGKTGTLEIAA